MPTNSTATTVFSDATDFDKRKRPTTRRAPAFDVIAEFLSHGVNAQFIDSIKSSGNSVEMNPDKIYSKLAHGVKKHNAECLAKNPPDKTSCVKLNKGAVAGVVRIKLSREITLPEVKSEIKPDVKLETKSETKSDNSRAKPAK